MPHVDRIIIPGQSRKIPHPAERFHMEELTAPEYHLVVTDHDSDEAVAAVVEKYTELQAAWLARQEALCKQRWAKHKPRPRPTPPTEKQLNKLAMTRRDWKQATGKDWPFEVPAVASEVSDQIDAIQDAMTANQRPATAKPEPSPVPAARAPTGLVPAKDLDVAAYDAKLRQWFQDVVRDLEAATGEPVRVPAPSSEAELRDLCKNLSDERKALGVQRSAAKWSGHDNPNYPAGNSMALRDRRCSYEHCDGRQGNLGRMIESNVWDFSIRNHGRPLCRDCQGVAPRV